MPVAPSLRVKALVKEDSTILCENSILMLSGGSKTAPEAGTEETITGLVGGLGATPNNTFVSAEYSAAFVSPG
ncbi:MAG: hypothetical protein BWY02_02057 [bacterium ADurb.Bin157]|nr:MAG: hypothetical protein BWY02_02057 [bacterium ADurb.Bin157]